MLKKQLIRSLLGAEGLIEQAKGPLLPGRWRPSLSVFGIGIIVK